MKRVLAIALASAFIVGVMGAAVWAYDAKLWLMDDYRSGFDLGSDYVGKDAQTLCWKTVYEVHGQSLDEADGAMPEAAQAFEAGCLAAATGEDDDAWHVAGYIDG